MEDRFSAVRGLDLNHGCAGNALAFSAYNIIYDSNLDNNIIGTFGQDMIFAAATTPSPAAATPISWRCREQLDRGRRWRLGKLERGRQRHLVRQRRQRHFRLFQLGNGGADLILDFEVATDVLRLADLIDENDDGVTVGSATDGDLLLTFSNGASVELNDVQNPKIDTLAELAQLITVDFG